MASLRHRVRIAALQALFEVDATDHAPDGVIERLVVDEELPPDGVRFFERVVLGAWEHHSYLDRIIEEAAPNWPVSQMPGVDKAILRIALYEILIDDAEKTPVKAVINEAVELAKHFGSDNSSRFVNGVLGTVVSRYIEGRQQPPHTRPATEERENRPMATSELEVRLKKIIAEQLGVDESKVVPSASFTDNLDADSLDLVELIMSLEEEFSVEIPDEEAEKILTVGDALNYLTAHAGTADEA